LQGQVNVSLEGISVNNSSVDRDIIRFDHTKAKNMYKEADPEKDFLRMIMDKMEDVPTEYTLKQLIEDFSITFARGETGDAISVLEAIYEALDIIDQRLIEDTQCDKDSLFNQALKYMRKTAEYYDQDELLYALDELYQESTIRK
jgi:hypothetical protein